MGSIDICTSTGAGEGADDELFIENAIAGFQHHHATS